MERLESFKKERESLGLNQLRALPIDAERSKIEVTNDRIIKGYAIVWGERNSHDEIVLKGATLNSLSARGVGSTKNSIVVLKHHKIDQPIARLLKLEEDEYGLYFEAEIIRTPLGDETIEEINSGVLRQLSYGFSYVWDKVDYIEQDDVFILREIKLYEISLVTLSSGDSAQLRSFGEYQKQQILKDITPEGLRALHALIGAEIASRDEHLETTEEVGETEEVDPNKVSFF